MGPESVTLPDPEDVARAAVVALLSFVGLFLAVVAPGVVPALEAVVAGGVAQAVTNRLVITKIRIRLMIKDSLLFSIQLRHMAGV
jgi:hypothetical protein